MNEGAKNDDPLGLMDEEEQIDEALPSLKKIAKALTGKPATEKSKKEEEEKESTNENWARVGKDKQLFEELLTRWCK